MLVAFFDRYLWLRRYLESYTLPQSESGTLPFLVGEPLYRDATVMYLVLQIGLVSVLFINNIRPTGFLIGFLPLMYLGTSLLNVLSTKLVDSVVNE